MIWCLFFSNILDRLIIENEFDNKSESIHKSSKKFLNDEFNEIKLNKIIKGTGATVIILQIPIIAFIKKLTE
jgi:hypothetical protein